jgi:K+-transporting ATPase KdpF subunit
MDFSLWAGAVIGVGLFIYLFVALIKPEKF